MNCRLVVSDRGLGTVMAGEGPYQWAQLMVVAVKKNRRRRSL